jgi:hypothetical protein
MEIHFKNLPVIIILFLSISFSCSSGIKESERWEGLKKGKLRVYVRDSMEDIVEGEDFGKKAGKKLLKMANDRAVHLLISYIRTHIMERSRYDSFNNEILAIIGKGVLKYEDCNEEYCEAFADYDTAALIEKINTAAKIESAPRKKETIRSEKETEKDLER